MKLTWEARLAELENGQTGVIPHKFEGAVQILTTSGETIPNVVGLWAFHSRQCVIADTEQEQSTRLRQICARLKIQVLNLPHERFTLDPFRFKNNVAVGEAIVKFLKHKTVENTPILWNYTPGTKPMVLGLMQGLAPLTQTQSFDALYVDTREPLPLILRSEPEPLPFPRPIAVSDLLTAQGIHWKNAFVLGPHIREVMPEKGPPHIPFDPTSWLRKQFRHSFAWSAPGNTKQMQESDVHLNLGEWLTCSVAFEILNSGRVSEVWMGTKVSQDANFEPGSDQEIDLMFALRAGLYICECKLNRKTRKWRMPDGSFEVENAAPGDAVLKIAQVAKLIGGRLAQPVFICNKNLVTDAVRRKASREGVWVVRVGQPRDVVEQLDSLILKS